MADLDAVVIGAGPNGLAAAIALAREGRSVTVFEAASEVGGGARSAELTLPGFMHDVCSAVHPMGILSPFFRELPLEDHGLVWLRPRASVAHPMPDGPARDALPLARSHRGRARPRMDRVMRDSWLRSSTARTSCSRT